MAGDTRVATLLFCDVVGGSDHDPAGASLASRLATIVVERGGELLTGVDVPRLGAVFGSSLDAIDAAVAMQRATDRLARHADLSLLLRVGIHAGEVDTGEVELTSPPAVITARLSEAAGAGQIAISELAQGLMQARSDLPLGPLAPFRLRGLREPVLASTLSWLAPSSRLPLPASIVGGHGPFVGRGSDLGKLLRAWSDATGDPGRPRLYLLAGEPGIGKTRLATELAGVVHVEGATVLFGRCDDAGTFPYQPFVEALRPWVGHADPTALRATPELGRLFPELLARLPRLEQPAQLDPDSERHRLFDAVADLVATVADEAPTLLVLDDLHWADRGSLLLLRHLLRRGSALPLMIVATCRDTEVGRSHPLADLLADLRRDDLYDRMPITGLATEDVAALVPDRSLADAVVARTAGNPFFVIELSRHLAETGSFELPEGIREVIDRRLAHLGKEPARILQVASVMGVNFRLDVLERLPDLIGDDVVLALEQAAAAGLLIEVPGTVGKWRFPHALVRDALYHGISSVRRARLHRSIGEALEELGGTDPAELAHHFAESAGTGDVTRAVAYSEQAGQAALAQLAYEEAANHFSVALGLLEGQPVDGDVHAYDLLVAKGEALGKMGDLAGAWAAHLEAATVARRLQDPLRLGRAVLGLSGAWRLGFEADYASENAELISLLNEALVAVGQDHPHVRVRLLARLASTLAYSGAPGRARDISAEALGLARGLDDPLLLAATLYHRHVALMGPHGVAERMALAREMRDLGEALSDLEVLLNGHLLIAYDELEAGNLAEADHHAQAIEALIAEHRLTAYRPVSLMYRGMRATAEGRFDDAEALAGQLLEPAHRSWGMLNTTQVVAILMFAFENRRGRLGGYESSVQDLIRDYPATESWRAALAYLYAETGRLDLARDEFERLATRDGFGMTEDLTWFVVMALLAETCCHLGDADRASRMYDALVPFDGRNLTILTFELFCPVARALGLLAATMGRPDLAEGHFNDALAQSERLGLLPNVALTKYDLARLVLSGDRTRGLPLVADAVAMAEALGMEGLAGRAGALLAGWSEDTSVPTPVPTRSTPQPATGADPPAATAPLQSSRRFVGRENELAILAGALDAARAGEGSLQLLVGEPGIGKTALALEFGARAAPVHVVWGRCWEGGGAPAYWPWREILQQLGAPDLLAGSDPAPEGTLEERFAVFRAVVDVFRLSAAGGPLVAVLDDLHAADVPSLALLQFVSRSLAELPVLIVGIYREEEAPPELIRAVGTGRHLQLRGLSRQEVAQLLPPETTDRLVGDVQRATDGNPFFVTELAPLVASDGRLGIPAGVRATLRRRLGQLSADATEMVATAAAWGQELDLAVLLRACSLSSERLLELVGEAVVAGLVAEQDGHGRFSHALVRETIYDDLGPVERARVHLRLGEALEALAEDGTALPGVLAHHWRQAAPLGDPAKAIQYTLQAAEAAYAAFGFEDAINLWESAHDLMRSHGAPPEQQARLLERLATGRFTAGLDVARGVTALEKALAIWEELGRGEEAARTHARLGQGLFFSDAMDITRALRHLQAARDVLEAGPSSPLLARLLAAEAGARLYSLELDRSADLSAQAMELAGQFDDRVGWAAAAFVQGAALVLTGDLGPGVELLDRAWQVADGPGAVLMAFACTSVAAWMLWDLRDPRQSFRRCDRELARGRLGPSLAADLEYFQTICRAVQGIAGEQPAGRPAANARIGLGAVDWLALFAGRWDDAAAAARRLRDRAQRIGDRLDEAFAGLALAEAARAAGRPAAAIAALDAALAIVMPAGHVVYELAARGELALLHAEAGRPAVARAHLARCDEITAQGEDWRGRDGRLVLAAAAADAAEGRFDAAEVEFDDGVGIARHYGLAFDEADAEQVWAAARARAGDRAGAGDHLEAALAIYQRIGAGSPWLDRVGAGLVLTESPAPLPAAPVTAVTFPAPTTEAERRDTATPPTPSPPDRSRFAREGEFWTITYAGVTSRLRDSKGMACLARLLATPGQECHVLELAAVAEGQAAAPDAGDAGPVLDERAKAAYRRRLTDLAEDLEEARANHDLARVAQLEAEIDTLTDQLAAAVGLGGRDRRAASAAERARVNVTRVVRAAVNRIAEANPALGRHLDVTIRTGMFCCYTPDPAAAPNWEGIVRQR